MSTACKPAVALFPPDTALPNCPEQEHGSWQSKVLEVQILLLTTALPLVVVHFAEQSRYLLVPAAGDNESAAI